MQSVTSLFNTSLLRRNIRRFWPIWLIYTVIWFMMMPVAMLLELLLATRYGDAVIGGNFTNMVLGYSALPQIILGACMGVLLAMSLFSYLCTARSVGMMHSLPISRKSLFITNYLSGLLMLFGTHFATFLFTGFVEASFDILAMGELWQWLWVSCGTGFFSYSFAVLCAVFAGQVLAVPVFYGILNFVAIGMYYLLDGFAAVFRYGSGGSVLNFERQISWLSPLYRMVSDISARNRYIENTDIHVRYLTGQSTVLVYVVAGVAVTVIAFAAYLRRKSESAGDVVAVTWAKPVFKYGVAFCMAFTAGLGMYRIFIASFLSVYETSIPGAVACLVFMGIVGYYIAEMLVQKSFKVFRKGRKGALFAALGIALISCCMTLDLTGYDTYMPDRSEVEGVRAYVNGPDFHIDYNGTDDAALDDVYALHAAIIAKREEQTRRGKEWNYGEDLIYTYVDIEYYCADGSMVERRYETYHLNEELGAPGTLAYALGDFVYNEAVIAQYFLRHDPSEVKQILGGRFSYLDVEDEYAWNEVELTEVQAEAVYGALLTDLEMLSLEKATAFDKMDAGFYHPKECELTLYYLDVNGNSRDVYINFGSFAEATIRTLYESGVIPVGTELAQWSDEKNDYEFIAYDRPATTVAVG